VQSIAEDHLRKGYKMIDLAQNLKNKTARRVQHLAVNVPFFKRIEALASLCKIHNSSNNEIVQAYGDGGRAIVFTQTKADANELQTVGNLPPLEVMHGDISQFQREQTLHKFKEGRLKILVATDVASRGLDIPNVELVVQIEPPKDTETYIHRSGRTARAGKEGKCITIYSRNTEFLIQQIEMQAGIKFEHIDVPKPGEVVQMRKQNLLKKFENVNPSEISNYTEDAEVSNCSY
jgi:ATP-dependent RNA helicase DDX21